MRRYFGDNLQYLSGFMSSQVIDAFFQEMQQSNRSVLTSRVIVRGEYDNNSVVTPGNKHSGIYAKYRQR